MILSVESDEQNELVNKIEAWVHTGNRLTAVCGEGV